jgi:ribose 5-phosphate isomerase A
MLDARFGPISDPHSLARELSSRAGIAEHGLFLGMTDDLLIAGDHGVEHVRRKAA